MLLQTKKQTQFARDLKGHNQLPSMVNHQCMADSDDSIVITPSGLIGKCEHFTDKKMIGSIFNESFDMLALNMWRERYERQNECYTCPHYPSCIRIKMCPNQKQKCSDFYRKNYIDFLTIAIEHYYNDWKSKKS